MHWQMQHQIGRRDRQLGSERAVALTSRSVAGDAALLEQRIARRDARHGKRLRRRLITRRRSRDQYQLRHMRAQAEGYRTADGDGDRVAKIESDRQATDTEQRANAAEECVGTQIRAARDLVEAEAPGEGPDD